MNSFPSVHVPPDIHRKYKRRIKFRTAAHLRSVKQEVILDLEFGLSEEPARRWPTAEEIRSWLAQQLWTLLVLDQRSAEEILG